MSKSDAKVLNVVNELLEDKSSKYTSTKIMLIIQMILSGRCNILNKSVLYAIVESLSDADKVCIQTSIQDVLSLLDKHGGPVVDYYDDVKSYNETVKALEDLLHYLKYIPATTTRNIPFLSERVNYYTKPVVYSYIEDTNVDTRYNGSYIVTSNGFFKISK